MRVVKSFFVIIFVVFLSAVASILTDTILEYLNILPKQNPSLFANWMWYLAIFYRTLYTIMAGYLVARWAPTKPLVLSYIIAGLAFLANLAGYFASLSGNLGPSWYPLLLTIFAIPASLFGSFLRLKKIWQS